MGKSWAAVLFAAVGALLALLPACGKSGRDHGPAKDTVSPSHEHVAPHGGTPVVLGDEAYHLELVRIPGEDRLQAYVLDREMENFVRCPAPSFEVVAVVAGEKRPLTFVAVADAATGENVGDTALFEAKADWLVTATKFDAVLTSLTIRGTKFADVPFNFPEGNVHEDHPGHNH